MTIFGTILLYVSLVASCAIAIILLLCVKYARKHPRNLIMLLIFTLCESYMVGYLTQSYDYEIVFLAAFCTFGIVFALTIYACKTKTDFTMQGGMFFVTSISLMMIGMIVIYTNQSILTMIFLFVSIVFYGAYLIFDTQLIIGGKRL